MRKEKNRKPKFSEGLIDENRIIEILDIKEGQTILDAGCGTGYMAELFSKKVSNKGIVYAVDNDTFYHKELVEILKDTEIKVMFEDITGRTGIETSSIDLIYISSVVHCFRENKMREFSKEAERLLKKGGILAVVEIEKKETPFGPSMENRYSPSELRKLISLTPVNNFRIGDYFHMQVFKNE